MPNATKCIVLQLKDGREIASSYVDASEAERLLEEEVLPKIGFAGAIQLPGAIARAPEVVGAYLRSPRTVSLA